VVAYTRRNAGAPSSLLVHSLLFLSLARLWKLDPLKNSVVHLISGESIYILCRQHCNLITFIVGAAGWWHCVLYIRGWRVGCAHARAFKNHPRSVALVELIISRSKQAPLVGNLTQSRVNKRPSNRLLLPPRCAALYSLYQTKAFSLKYKVPPSS
jgi:hypothetical protein